MCSHEEDWTVPVYAEINHGRLLTIVICCCSCQLAGIKRHKELSFFLQPKPQGVVSTNSRVPSDSEYSSTQKKVLRSRKVSQLQTSPLSHISFESSETDHETMEDATLIKRRAWHSGERQGGLHQGRVQSVFVPRVACLFSWSICHQEHRHVRMCLGLPNDGRAFPRGLLSGLDIFTCWICK